MPCRSAHVPDTILRATVNSRRTRTMLHEPYTPAVTRALEAAPDWARRHRAAAVEPVHVLQGLLQEEGRAAVLLAGAGLPHAQALAALAAGAAALLPPDGTPPPASDLTERSLRAARALAREIFGERTVA